MIRPTTPEDAPALVELTRATGFFKPLEIEALEEVLQEYFDSMAEEGHLCVTLEAGTEILGFAYWAEAAMTDRTWYLWWIAVRKDQQGRGLGGELLRYVEADIRGREGRVVFIETGSKPLYAPTRQFYLRQGYTEEALLRDFYAEGDSMVIYRKSLV